MSKRLRELMQDKVIREGAEGWAKLCLAAKRREKMVERYMKGLSIPEPNAVYNLALACGCSDEEALAMVKECSPEARETA